MERVTIEIHNGRISVVECPVDVFVEVHNYDTQEAEKRVLTCNDHVELYPAHLFN